MVSKQGTAILGKVSDSEQQFAFLVENTVSLYLQTLLFIFSYLSA